MDEPAGARHTAPEHGTDDAEALAALAFAADLVSRLGERAAGRQSSAVEDRKPAEALTGAVVTDVDLELEAAVDAALHDRYPADGVLGEEGADRPSTSGRTWIIDPIDGTLNYARRLGPWSVVVSRWSGPGLLVCDLVAVWTGGVLYTAVRGVGAWRDGQRLALSGPAEAGGIVRVSAVLAAPVAEAGWLVKMTESSAAEVVSIADGRVTGTIRLRGDRRDLHAPALVVAEAGGAVSALDGGAWDGGTHGLVLAHPGAHEALLALVPPRR